MSELFRDSTYLNLKEYSFIKPTYPKVMALAGLRKSGKTRTANIIQSMDDRFVIKSFASKLKELFAEAKGVTVEDLCHNSKKEQYRQEIVDFSWQVKADKGLFYFAETFFNSLDHNKLTVCDDIRIIEELQLLILFGGVAYKVYSPDHMRAARGWKFDPIIDNDISETELGLCSGATFYHATGGGVLYNTKDDNYLREQLGPILKRHFPENAVAPVYPDFFNKLITMEM